MNVVYDLKWASFGCSTGNILYIISNGNHCSTLTGKKTFSKISYSLLKIFVLFYNWNVFF